VLPDPVILAPVTSVDAPKVRSIVELDGNTYVFDEVGVTVLRAGAVVGRDELAATATPSTILAPDGESRWVMSGLERVTPDGTLAPINEERLGLTTDTQWTGVYGAGKTIVATSPKAMAVSSDGHHVALYPPTDAREIAVADGQIALAGPHAIDVWDLATAKSRSFPVANAHVGFVGTNNAYVRQTSRLVAWTPEQLAVEGADAKLHVIATGTPIAGVAISSKRIWVLADGHVAYLDPGTTMLQPAAIGAQRVDKIFGSSSGDVWAISGGKLARYAVTAATGAAPASWTASVAPVFARVCAHCHLPDGSSGVDLSTEALWAGERAEVRKRVVVQRTMPPAGTAMSDADRATIAAWAGSK
jgi:mono/diheme cytochrome c family protein